MTTFTSVSVRHILWRGTVVLAVRHLRPNCYEEVVVAIRSLLPLEAFPRDCRDEVAVVTLLDRHLLQLLQVGVEEGEEVPGDENLVTFQNEGVLKNVSFAFRGIDECNVRRAFPLSVLIIASKFDKPSTLLITGIL